MEEEASAEVLFETCSLATRTQSTNYPPRQFNDASGGGGLWSLLPTRGLTQLKEKWSGSKQPRKLSKLTSLFVSPKGERVAVAAGNQITVLRKDDNYQEPYGVFTSGLPGTFTCGAWSESLDVLGVCDLSDTLYFIRASGEEIVRIDRRHLKISSSIVGLLVLNEAEKKDSFLCCFNFLASDGTAYQIEISPNLAASLSSLRTCSGMKKQLSSNICAVHYSREDSLLALLGSPSNNSHSGKTGSCVLHIWRCKKSLEFQPVASVEFECLVVKPEGYEGSATVPKVQISPGGKYFATLDLRGCMNVFYVVEDLHGLSVLDYSKRHTNLTDDRAAADRRLLKDVVDFTWWSEHILVLAKNGGSVLFYDIVSDRKCLENDSVYSMIVLERIHQPRGEVLLLDSALPKEDQDSFVSSKIHNVIDSEEITKGTITRLGVSRLVWRLNSFQERSIPEMYDVFIKSKNYRGALDFADRHGLDKDRLFKSQWLNSSKGVNEINTLLSNVRDEAYVLGQCAEQVGPTEDAMKALLALGLRLTNHYHYFEKADSDYHQEWDFLLVRLRILQFRDRLDSFLGINMGRFSVLAYSKFRVMPINKVAVDLAENGKIGALNLLFKRHPYSLAPYVLDVLASIPETVPVQTYAQLLPGRSPPANIVVRDRDWVECEKMVNYIKSLPDDSELCVSANTEPIIKQILGYSWPAPSDISVWYMNRARDIDRLSGQLDNSLSLVDFGCRKKIYELEKFREDMSYLHELIYADGDGEETCFSSSYEEWESLNDYEKFRTILKRANEDNVVKILRDKAIRFMQNRSQDSTPSYLVRWMKDISVHNSIEICLVVIEEGCKDAQSGFFNDDIEAIDCSLQCIYNTNATNKWNTMASILSKLPHTRGPDTHYENFENLERRLKLAEGHIEAGRLLALYQVPKPMSFFLDSQKDEKAVKQILRLILSKFIRRQPSRSDHDWANMWRDLLCLQEKAFPFLDLEYLILEFCRGLLKAGKFSLARNYLKGTASVSLPAEKAENLVIQTAREYFFSASSLSCSEIWKAKECLDLFPSSRNVRAEADIIDALTVKLPSLGVHLLPLQYKQIKEPMDIVKMAVTSQSGAFLNVDELIEVAKLLGLRSEEDISIVQEAIAREAAVAGDLQLAFELCLVLSRKGHGLIWDLCAAIARGPAIENMDISSRKQLLGFALSHCDDESIGELLNAWKDLDLQGQCDSLMMLTGVSPHEYATQGSSILTEGFDNARDFSVKIPGLNEVDQEIQLSIIKQILSEVARDRPVVGGTSWDAFLLDNGKVLSFAGLQLPWLLALSKKSDIGEKMYPISVPGKHYVSVRTQSVLAVLSWLARYGFAPKDDLIASLAKSVMLPPVTQEEDILGCSFLLNLMDAFYGAEIIEEQLEKRENYQETCSIMNIGMTYSSLNNSDTEHKDPVQRRELLIKRFREKISADDLGNANKAQSTFWRGWKLKLEEQKLVTDRSRVLEQLIPGVDSGRFLSGDSDYIRSTVFSFIESLKLEKKHILKDVLSLADTYSLSHTEVLLKFLSTVLLSEVWTDEEITAEISEFKVEILDFAAETGETLTSFVYPLVDGHNKTRLAYIYGLLSECYYHLQESKEITTTTYTDAASISASLAHFCKILEQECLRVSFIRDLNFKNIADISGIKHESFNREVCDHVNEYSVGALAKLVETLVGSYPDLVPHDLISWQDVHRYYVLSLLRSLENRAKCNYHVEHAENIQCMLSELEQTYDMCRDHIKVLECQVSFDVMKKFFKSVALLQVSTDRSLDSLPWKDSLIVLLNFWARLGDDMLVKGWEDDYRFDSLVACVKAFLGLVIENKVPCRVGWQTVYAYAVDGLSGGLADESFYFCKAMVLSGCDFEATEAVLAEASQNMVDQTVPSDTAEKKILDVSELYLDILDTTLESLINESSKRLYLHSLLSSLGKMVEDKEILRTVRVAIWTRLADFSGNLQLPSHVRVYILEVMQCVLGRSSRLCIEQGYHIVPWEGWVEMNPTNNDGSDADPVVPGQSEASNRLESTLVALRSTKLASSFTPSTEITPDDLLTTDSAVTCFSRLCESAAEESHFNCLIAILGEWENVFAVEKANEGVKDHSDVENNWTDDWGDEEGWESFDPVEEKDEKEKKDGLSVHPLHACWAEMMKKLILLSRYGDTLNIIDKHVVGKEGAVLINQDEAHGLTEMLHVPDCFMALKLALLLPYGAMQVHWLNAVEESLKQEGIPDPEPTRTSAFELLVLMLYSGAISIIVSEPSYSSTFSYICYLIGEFLRAHHDSQLSRRNKHSTEDKEDDDEDNYFFVFGQTLFPCFVSELVKSGQQILAGFLVTKFVHTNPAFSVLNVAEATLRKYLKTKLQALEAESCSSSNTGEVLTYEKLRSSIFVLNGKLKASVDSALSFLPSSSR